jgi:hypothetical protein
VCAGLKKSALRLSFDVEGDSLEGRAGLTRVALQQATESLTFSSTNENPPLPLEIEENRNLGL